MRESIANSKGKPCQKNRQQRVLCRILRHPGRPGQLWNLKIPSTLQQERIKMLSRTAPQNSLAEQQRWHVSTVALRKSKCVANPIHRSEFRANAHTISVNSKMAAADDASSLACSALSLQKTNGGCPAPRRSSENSKIELEA